MELFEEVLQLERNGAQPSEMIELLSTAFREDQRNPIAINLYSHLVMENSKNSRLKDKCFYLLKSIEDVNTR